jgi:hypothetical protein
VPFRLNGIGSLDMLAFPANCAEVNIMPAEDILNMVWNFTLQHFAAFFVV